jgi:hypothetical protein
MAPLKAVGLSLAMAMATSAHAAFAATPSGWSRWSALIAIASARYGIPANWITRVIQEESGGHTRLLGQPIRSRAGAMGLMQLMPQTWEEMRDRYGLGSDPDDPRDNVIAGTAYLRMMYDRFGYPGLFAAYNAGPARYAAYLRSGVALPTETISYLATLTVGGQDRRRPSPVGNTLFALRRSLVDDRPEAINSAKLFAITGPSAPTPTIPTVTMSDACSMNSPLSARNAPNSTAYAEEAVQPPNWRIMSVCRSSSARTCCL